MDLNTYLENALVELEQKSLFRQLRPVDRCSAVITRGDAEFINFASNDYLGLAQHPDVVNAVRDEAARSGAGSGASRLLAGSLQIHHELEAQLARYKRTEASLLFSSGYSCALGVVPALCNADSIIILDKLVHASLVDASKLSGAKLRVFRHNDLNDLEEKLKWAADVKGNKLVIAESIYSMDGDAAPVKEIVHLKNQYGAWLLLDEAHATGVIGSGLAAEEGVSAEVDIQMGTLGKALGNSGGFICGSRKLISFLVNKARSFIYSTAPPPHVSAGAIAALKIVESKEGNKLRSNLSTNLEAFRKPVISQIVPVHAGPEEVALELAKGLETKGIYAPAIRYPTVAKGAARIRLSFTAAHRLEDVQKLKHALAGYV